MPADSKFVMLVSGPVEEWLPHLAWRTVLNGLWGSEWEPEDQIQITSLRGQLAKCQHLECVRNSVEDEMGYGEVYLYAELDKLPKLDVNHVDEESNASVLETLWQERGIVMGRLSKEWPMHPNQYR